MKKLLIFILILQAVPVFAEDKGRDHPVISTLKRNYKAALEKATEPIRAKFRAELERIRDEFTESKQFDEALAAQKEINTILSAEKASQELSDLKYGAIGWQSTEHFNIVEIAKSKRWECREPQKTLQFFDEKMVESATGLEMEWHPVENVGIVIMNTGDKGSALLKYHPEDKTFYGRFLDNKWIVLK